MIVDGGLVTVGGNFALLHEADFSYDPSASWFGFRDEPELADHWWWWTWDDEGFLIDFALWPVAALVGVVGMILIWPLYRRRKSAACSRCGYNLTGNVSGTCPECGTLVQQHDAGGNESVPTKEED